MDPLRTGAEGRHEKRRATVRALHLDELEAVGAARKRALKEADDQLDRLARLLPDALAGGLTLTEIARITGVSRPTLYQLRGRYGDSASDFSLAVLQSLATRGPTPLANLYEHLGRQRHELRETLKSFESRGLIEYAPLEQEEEGASVELTDEGGQFLERWFELANEEGREP